MNKIRLECPECFRSAEISSDSRVCLCGYAFQISDESVFDNPNYGVDLDDLSLKVMVSTETFLDGFSVKRRFGIVSSEYVAGVNVLREVVVGMTDFFGGRSGTLQRELRLMKHECLRDMRYQALELGANAIIAVDLKYSNFSWENRFMMLLAATGTAVELEAVSTESP